MGVIQDLTATKTLYVNVGHGAVITCRNIPVDRAHRAVEAYLAWLARPNGNQNPFAVDVMSTNDTRTVVPHTEIVTIRIGA